MGTRDKIGRFIETPQLEPEVVFVFENFLFDLGSSEMAETNENNETFHHIEDNHSVHNKNNEARDIHYNNPPVRTLHDYLHPTRRSIPSCIIFPMNDNNFNFKPGMIQLLPSFQGMKSENPYSHVREFEEVCGTFSTEGCRLDTILLKLFPFSLKDKAKTWFYSLRPRTIGTWLEMQTVFFKKFFSIQKTNSLKRQMTTFAQNEIESLPQAWERYKDLLMSCPHHGFEIWRIVGYFYDGLLPKDRQFIEIMCNGNFMNKDPDDAFDFIDEITEKSQNWTPSESSHIIVQKTKVSANASSNGIDRLKEEDGLKAQIAKIAREVETLNSKLLHGFNSVTSEENFNICEVCEVMGHATKECPILPVFRNMLHEHANYINQLKKSSSSHFSEIYNPQKELKFSSYSPQMQEQSPQLQSLEGVLKQFMQSQNATNKRTAQEIGGIKKILSKLTSALSFDEEGKFPAQTQPNPVGQFE
ncbi:hypothetical protein ACE6H2_014105 [Prunus campanulata]